MMQRINRWDVARRAYRWWKRNYINTGRATKKAIEIGERLKKLGSDPHPDKVDTILGGRSWTLEQMGKCKNCSGFADELVQFLYDTEDPEDINAVHFSLCNKCLLKALQLLEE